MTALPHLHDTGDGPPLLMLHAYPLDASQWDHQVAALSDRWRCLRPDFWGFGSSPSPPPQTTLDSYAAAVLAALDDAQVENFAVCGLSMGGYVAFALLRAAATRVGTLILADTRADADGEETRAVRERTAQEVLSGGVEPIVEATVQRLLAPRSQRHPHISDPVRGRIRRSSAAGVAAAQRAMAVRPDSTAQLAGIRVPTLVICGTEDAVTPPGAAQAIAAGISGAQLSLMEGVGHLSNLERPAEFSALAGDFLDRQRSSF